MKSIYYMANVTTNVWASEFLKFFKLYLQESSDRSINGSASEKGSEAMFRHGAPAETSMYGSL